MVTVGQFEQAIDLLENAAAIFRETGDQHSEGSVLLNLGAALQGVGQFDEAITAYQDAAGIFQETGNRRLEGKASEGGALAAYRRDAESGNIDAMFHLSMALNKEHPSRSSSMAV